MLTAGPRECAQDTAHPGAHERVGRDHGHVRLEHDAQQLAARLAHVVLAHPLEQPVSLEEALAELIRTELHREIRYIWNEMPGDPRASAMLGCAGKSPVRELQADRVQQEVVDVPQALATLFRHSQF